MKSGLLQGRQTIGSPESRVFILVALARVNASNWFNIKPIARVYTRECHENKNTRFWATYGQTARFRCL